MFDVSCFLAFTLFLLSDILEIAAVVKGIRNFKDHDEDSYASDLFYQACPHSDGSGDWLDFETCLVPDFVKSAWEFRQSVAGLTTAVSFTSAAAWLFLALPLCQVAWILSRAGRRRIALHGVICLLTVTGSLMELIARLLMLGVNNTTEWFYDAWNVEVWNASGVNDYIGLRVLEMLVMSYQGLMLWIDAFEWLALSIILTLIFVSVRAERQSYLSFMRTGGGTSPSMAFGFGWSIFGLVIAVIAFFTFVFNVLRFQNWTVFSTLGAVCAALNGLILLPIWILLLGLRLHRLRMSFEEELALQVDNSSDKLPTPRANGTATEANGVEMTATSAAM